MADGTSGYDLSRSRRALERIQRAREAARAATEKLARSQPPLRLLNSEYAIILHGLLEEARNKAEDPKYIALLERRLEELDEEATRLDKERKEAEEEERHALEELAEASEDFGVATVEPRVEAAKLSFEEHKLRATLSSASIVGIAATSGILLPKSTSYVAVLGAAFVCLFVSTILSLRAMKQTTEHVEDTLISAAVAEQRGPLAWLTRHTFNIGLIVFAAFIILNLVS